MQARIGFFCTLLIGLLTFGSCSHAPNNCLWLYDYIPESQEELPTRSLNGRILWALLGNDDDGIFGEKDPHFQGDYSLSTALSWQLRNPLHNFCYYIIGSANSVNDEWDLLKITPKGICIAHYHPIGKTVFADPANSLYLGLHGLKPFISLNFKYLPSRQFAFYAGWRERGNFGLKLQPFKPLK